MHIRQHVLKATKQVNGKGQNSTPRHAKTPLRIFTKIGMRDYVVDGTWHAKFCGDRFRVFAPQICDFDVLQGGLVFNACLGSCNSLQPTPTVVQ